MAETTFSFRIPPPLYGLQDAELEMPNLSDGRGVKVRVTLVDSDRPSDVRVSVSGSGSVTLPGDNFGMIHNTRLDVTAGGTVDEWMSSPDGSARIRTLLTLASNRLINWYRFDANQPLVRRIPVQYISAFEFGDGERVGQSFMPGPTPGERSVSAGEQDAQLVQQIGAHVALRTGIPLWLSLYSDAVADFQSGETHSAVLLANTALETLVNHGFRFAARKTLDDAELEAVFEADATVFHLLKRINELAPTELTNSQLTRLASKVRQDRNIVIHGYPVPLERDRVAAALDALSQLISVVAAALAHGEG